MGGAELNNDNRPKCWREILGQEGRCKGPPAAAPLPAARRCQVEMSKEKTYVKRSSFWCVIRSLLNGDERRSYDDSCSTRVGREGAR